MSKKDKQRSSSESSCASESKFEEWYQAAMRTDEGATAYGAWNHQQKRIEALQLEVEDRNAQIDEQAAIIKNNQKSIASLIIERNELRERIKELGEHVHNEHDSCYFVLWTEQAERIKELEEYLTVENWEYYKHQNKKLQERIGELERYGEYDFNKLLAELRKAQKVIEFYGDHGKWEQNHDYPNEASFLGVDLEEIDPLGPVYINDDGYEFEKVGGKRARQYLSALPPEIKELLEEK